MCIGRQRGLYFGTELVDGGPRVHEALLCALIVQVDASDTRVDSFTNSTPILMAINDNKLGFTEIHERIPAGLVVHFQHRLRGIFRHDFVVFFAVALAITDVSTDFS